MNTGLIMKPLGTTENKNDLFKTIRIRKKNKKNFKEDDIKEWVKQYSTSAKIDARNIAVSAMGVTNDFTLKHFGRLEFYATEDYYNGKVDDIEKFDSYDYFDVVLRIHK